MKKLLLAFLFSASLFSQEGAIPLLFVEESSGDVERKHPIVLQSSQVSGTGSHTNIPVLITLDMLDAEVVDAGTNSALTNGDDLIFTSDLAGTNRLSIEIVEFVADATPGNRRCQVWVKIPTLSTSSDTTIYVWYNEPSRTQPAASAAFGSQDVWTNYYFVSHDMITESSSGRTITQSSSAGTTTSPFGTSTADFNGSGNHHVASVTDFDVTSGFTVTMWAQFNNSGTFQRMVHLANNTGHFAIIKGADGEPDHVTFGSVDVAGDGVDASDVVEADLGAQGSWIHIKASSPDGINSPDLRIDNVDYTNSSTFGYFLGVNNQELTIGGRSDNASYFEGALSNLFISTLQLSDDYIATQYNNQSSPSTFGVEGTPINAN